MFSKPQMKKCNIFFNFFLLFSYSEFGIGQDIILIPTVLINSGFFLHIQ